MNNDQTHQIAAPAAQITQIHTGMSIFDDGTFIGIMRVAEAMAASPLVPESLRTEKKGGNVTALSPEQVKANCFLVTEQAQRWGISPFAAIACASNIYGRLMWEGKLVAGVLEAKLGVRLNYEYSGQGDAMTVTVSGILPGEDTPRTVAGKVSDWKTDQWKSSAYEQRLAYRGAREWARRHAPSIMLGVVTEDEMEEPKIRTAKGTVIGSDNSGEEIDPFTPPASPVKQEPAPAEPEPQPEAPAQVEQAPAAKKEEKAKREQKERVVCDAKFRTITPKEGNGKKFWVVGVLINGQYREVTTFSSTIADSMEWIDENTNIRITVIPGPKANQLESFEVIKPEGNLI
jgi:hypothetical protein